VWPTLLWFIVCVGLAAPAQAALSSTPDRTYVTNGPVVASAVSDSTLYIGGGFTMVGPRTGPGVGVSAASGANLGLAEFGSGSVDAVVADGAGGWFVGGTFASVAGQPIRNLAHIRSDGSLDPSFAPNPDGNVDALALSGSVLYASGEFDLIGSQVPQPARTGLAALNTTDGSAAAWNPHPVVGLSPNLTVSPFAGPLFYTRTDIALSPDGTTLYVAGGFSQIGAQSPQVARSGLAAVSTADGTANAWNPAPNGNVYTIKASPDGRLVYVGGYFSAIGSQSPQPRRFAVAALTTTDGTATSWDPSLGNDVGTSDIEGGVNTIAVSPDGQTVYVGGSFNQDNLGAAAFRASDGGRTAWSPNLGCRTNRHGECQSTEDFGALHDTAVNAIAVSPDANTVYVAGEFDSAGGSSVERPYLAALSATDGSATAWNPRPDEPPTAIAVSSDGSSIFIGGTGLSSVGADDRGGLAALDTASGTETSWNPRADGGVSTLALSPDGSTLYAAGSFDHIGVQVPQPARNGVAAVSTADGSVTDWNPAPSATDPNGRGPLVTSIAVSPDNQTVFIAGRYDHIGAQASPLARAGLAAVGRRRWHCASVEPQAGTAERRLRRVRDQRHCLVSRRRHTLRWRVLLGDRLPDAATGPGWPCCGEHRRCSCHPVESGARIRVRLLQ
jgi:WD40 repeat protein